LSAEVFLNDEQLAQLTGRRFKSLQIAWLKEAGIPFRVNATGHPVVTRAAVEGRQEQHQPAPSHKPQGWQPRVIAGRT
jgi:hypothetical protein